MNEAAATDTGPATPETHAEKVSFVSDLIQGQSDTPEPTENEGGTGGEGAQAAPGSEDAGRAGPVDAAEYESTEGVEADSEGETGADTEPYSLSELANHLKVEQADLYDLQIPLGDGKATTLGEMKDNFKEFGPVKEMRDQVEQQRNDYEKQLLQTRTEINEIMQLIPAQIRGQLIEQARGRHKAWTQDQETLVLEAIPDWADPDKRAIDRAAIVESGAEYGFSEQEITYTQDARTLRMLRDFSNMRRELAEMKAAAKRQPGNISAPGKPAPKARKTNLRNLIGKAKQGTDQDKVRAVSALIGQ